MNGDALGVAWLTMASSPDDQFSWDSLAPGHEADRANALVLRDPAQAGARQQPAKEDADLNLQGTVAEFSWFLSRK